MGDHHQTFMAYLGFEPSPIVWQANATTTILNGGPTSETVILY